MAHALVTGASGFVGSNLVEHLRRSGWEVTCLVRVLARAQFAQGQGARLLEGSLDDPESIERSVQGCDTVFHVAGRVIALRKTEFHRDNVEGTRNVAEACAAQSNPPKLVMISSLAAGGPNRPGEPRREEDPPRPVSAYGESKLEAEREVASMADEVPVSIVRPPIVFGQRDTSSLTIFRGVKRLRLHLVPGMRKFPVSVVHVSDLCDALLRVAAEGERVVRGSNGKIDCAAGTYHVAAERTIDYSELGHLAAAPLERSALALRLPKLMMWMAGGTVDLVGHLRGRPGFLNLDKVQESLSPAWECNDEKIRRQLGYKPGATLEERFAETAQWYREEGWL